MCLYTKYRTPMIAPIDIPVLKYLNCVGDDYRTPYQGTLVRFNEKLKPASFDTPIRACPNNFNLYMLDKGALHARIVPTNKIALYCKQAIIPKGTEFWMDPFGLNIAAKEMIITNKSANTKNWNIPNFLIGLMLQFAPERNGIYVGDFLLTNGKFKHPSIYISKTEVCGQVCGFYKNGKPIICSIEKMESVWDSNCCNLGRPYVEYIEASNMFNGRKIMDYYRKHCSKDTGFEAFRQCFTYRIEHNEKWFLGAAGEVSTMLNNAKYLNAVRAMTGLGFYINEDYEYWSASEICRGDSFLSRLEPECVLSHCASKNIPNYIVPFFDSKRKTKKKIS